MVHNLMNHNLLTRHGDSDAPHSARASQANLRAVDAQAELFAELLVEAYETFYERRVIKRVVRAFEMAGEEASSKISAAVKGFLTRKSIRHGEGVSSRRCESGRSDHASEVKL